jgi:hypothetical protein
MHPFRPRPRGELIAGVTLARVTVTNQRLTCPGPLIEERPGSGVCARGDECEALALKPDYFAYRDAHTRIENEWPRGGEGTE